MTSDSKRKKKYRVRKGRVAMAAGILAAAVAAIAALCVFLGNKGNNDTNRGNKPVQGNTVDPDAVAPKGEYVKIDLEDCNLYVGSILRLKCSSQPEEYSKSVIWSTSDAGVVSVNGKGDIVVRSEGTAAITATCGLLSDSVIINAVNRASDRYNEEFPVYEVSENGELVVVQTAASGGETQGGQHSQTPQQTAAPPAVSVPEVPTGAGATQGSEQQTTSGTDPTRGNDPPTAAPPEQGTEAELTDRIVAGVMEAGFSKYLEDTYIYSEAGVYLGEIIVGDSFMQIYVMTRTTSFDAALKRVIMPLLPTEYDNVFAQLVSAEADRTFSADGYKVRVVAPTGGGHAQLIIYY